MDQEQYERYCSEWSEINQQIDRSWIRSKLTLSNHILSVARPFAVFVWIVVDLFHVAHLCDKAKVATK